MTPQQSYLEFAPPPTPGLLRGVVLAIIAHALLLAVLSAGVHWQRDAPVVTAEAELWSAIPQEAAPPPPPPAQATPDPEPPKPVPTPVKAPEPEVLPPQPDPSIAIARDKAKQRKEREQRELMEQEKRRKEKQLADKAQAEKADKLKLQKAKELKEKELKAAKDAQAAKDALDKRKESAADAKKLAAVRADALKRMAALAAGTGSSNSQGTATQSSGPSAGYAGRIRARIKPNITFTDTISGNPTAEVEVRTSPDGTIISRRLAKSSGVKSWDDAVLSAIDKTEVLPRDVDGRVPPALVISFRPRD